MVGFRLDQLRRTPLSIAIAGVPSKQQALRAVLRGRWVSMLVTDTATATALLTS